MVREPMRQLSQPVRLVMTGLIGAAAIGLGCGDASIGPDAAPARVLTATLQVGSDGRSPALGFTVPEGTRSVTVVARGAADALYGLAALTLADGVDLVDLPAGSPSAAMQASYLDEQIGQMPGDLYQSIRLGTFTQVYPYRPGQALPPGPASLAIASDADGPVEVTVLMPPDDDAATLHLNLVVVSETQVVAAPPPWLPALVAILAQADITVVLDAVTTLTGTGLAAITDFSEPQERPTSQSAQLPGLVAGNGSPALDVFLVDSLPAGVGGLSLGTPGPPIRGAYYYGVVVRPSSSDAATAEVIAHEVCHFLALQHIQNTGISGTIYPDPLDDTTAGAPNLMAGSGTTLTPDQTFALLRSALLAP